jgi:hypothetical protein
MGYDAAEKAHETIGKYESKGRCVAQMALSVVPMTEPRASPTKYALKLERSAGKK